MIELDTHQQGAEIAHALIASTHQRTVPNIFIGSEHVGGYDSLSALVQRTDEFRSMVERARAPKE